MITAANLRSQTVKKLAQMAKRVGVPGWHAMRKDQLVRALMRRAKAESSAPAAAVPAGKTSNRSARADGSPPAGAAKIRKATPGRAGANGGGRKKMAAAPKSARVARRIRQANDQRRRQKDLAGADNNGASPAGCRVSPNRTKPRDHHRVPQAKNCVSSLSNGDGEKDRIVLLVRGPYWLQACWELTRQSVQRARAAMAEHWHTAKPTLRLIEVETGATTSTAERVAREIQIHGGVKNWYIDVHSPPASFRVDIGYLAANGKFYALARSNQVTTPSPGSSDAVDDHWADVAENCEKIYALSGGYSAEPATGDLQELFEERLRRPMGPPAVTRFGVGAERLLRRDRDFLFDVDAEMIIFGATKPDAHVTLAGDPVKLRPDGTFTVRLSMPNRRRVVPVVASSGDGVEQRTIVLAVERNTKVMEPVIHEGAE